MTQTQLAWAAGIFEAHGHFEIRARRLMITQADPWALRRVQRILGGRVGGPYVKGYEKSLRKTPVFRWWCSVAEAELIAAKLIPFLSPRRRREAAKTFGSRILA